MGLYVCDLTLEFLIVCFFSSRRRHTRWNCDWSSDVCSSDLSRSPRRPPPPSRTTPREPVPGAKLPLAPASARTSTCAGPEHGSLPHPGQSATSPRPPRVCSQFPPQRKHRIQPNRPPNRRSASREGHDHRNRENHRQEHRRNRDLRIEDRVPNLMREQSSYDKSYEPADQCQQRGLREKH